MSIGDFMKSKILKGSIIAFILIIFLVSSVSAENKANEETKVLTLSKGNINFEKKPIEGDFYTFVNSTYKSMQYDSSFKLISSGDSVIGDRQAVEYIYTSNQNGIEREHKAVWFEKGGQAYVLLYSAPINQFEQNLYVFDYILSDIQIT